MYIYALNIFIHIIPQRKACKVKKEGEICYEIYLCSVLHSFKSSLVWLIISCACARTLW